MVIPPSIPFVIYAMLAEQSVGTMFMAGIIPGILMGVAFAVAALLYLRNDKNVIQQEKVPMPKRWAAPRTAREPAVPIGHGQGLDAWEIPSISADNTQIIEPGMRFNLHPVVVKKNGSRVSYCDCYISSDGAAERLSTLPYNVIYI